MKVVMSDPKAHSSRNQNANADLQDSELKDYTSASGQTHTSIAKLPGFTTGSGHKFDSIDIAYMTLGRLSKKKDNVILICHALSGSAHVAGIDKESGKPGWWDFHVGPGLSIDTNKFFIICSNVIGGCNGSTGPTTTNPKTGEPYGMDFPPVTIKDMVRAQVNLIEYLGINRLFAVVGGSMGGMQSLVWASDYPEKISHAIPIASSMHHSAMQIAFNEVGRQAIINDPNWNEGKYHSTNGPEHGLALARMMGHVTYLSEFSMHKKFGRKIQRPSRPDDIFPEFYSVESYLQHQGESFVGRFDPNSYLYITKALDRFDFLQDDQVQTAIQKIQAEFLIVSFASDWLYPAAQSRQMARQLKRSKKTVTYVNLDTAYGHDSFLIYNVEFSRILKGYLNKKYEQRQSDQ